MAECVEVEEEEKLGRVWSPWRKETEYDNCSGWGQLSPFDDTQATFQSCLSWNLYHLFCSCVWKRFWSLTVSWEKTSLLMNISDCHWYCFGKKIKSLNPKLSWAVESQWFSLVLLHITSRQQWAVSPVWGTASGLLQRNAAQRHWGSYKYPSCPCTKHN